MGIIKRYVAYLQDNPEQYWFKRKLFGWGWVPVRWQGWVFLLVWIALVVEFFRKVDALHHIHFLIPLSV